MKAKLIILSPKGEIYYAREATADLDIVGKATQEKAKGRHLTCVSFLNSVENGIRQKVTADLRKGRIFPRDEEDWELMDDCCGDSFSHMIEEATGFANEAVGHAERVFNNRYFPGATVLREIQLLQESIRSLAQAVEIVRAEKSNKLN